MAKLSLQEQLLQAGLIDKKKLKKAGKSSKKSRTLRKEAKAAVEENKASQLAQDQELNRQKQAEADKKAIASQVKQLIEMNKVEKTDGDIGYNFTDGSLVKKLHVNKQTHAQLVNGRLAIARTGESYMIIPGVVADKISQRDETSVIVNNVVSEDVMDEDDPYAAFQIPDDLMW
ncbi:DUF2058 domain-containing protein [Photobacterium japonica]|uniref:DUF2058 domain-containing protein n=1 Tax=Photobacterium japonica TaxID=2910235 RepID=UPI003D0F13FE